MYITSQICLEMHIFEISSIKKKFFIVKLFQRNFPFHGLKIQILINITIEKNVSKKLSKDENGQERSAKRKNHTYKDN